MDPLNGEPFIKVPDVQEEGLEVDIQCMHNVRMFFSNILFLGYTKDALEGRPPLLIFYSSLYPFLFGCLSFAMWNLYEY